MNNATSPPKFLNPFAGIDITTPQSDIKRVGSTLPKWIVNKIRSIRPEQGKGSGTIETTINLLLIKLINELERRNIQPGNDQVEFERLVCDTVLALPGELSDTEQVHRGHFGLANPAERPGSTNRSVDSKTSTSDDGVRTPSGGSTSAESKEQPSSDGSDVQEVGGGRGTGKRTGKGGKGKSI